jgi:hypothetical protein
MFIRLLLALIAALLIVRLPSLVQPMGPDQALYSYVGERILHGDLAYRDAWDQKPPGIHYVYAGLRALSKRDAIVPAADLAAAAMCAALLWMLGTRLGGPVAGGVSAAIFLLLSDPSFARYGGMRVRAQAETFIGLAVAGALALVVRSRLPAAGSQLPASSLRLGAFGAGVLIGLAFALKYNAGLYGIVVLLAMLVVAKEVAHSWRDAVFLFVGAAVIPLLLLARFWMGHALDDLYQDTIVYNVQYSAETYASRWEMLRYVFIAPIRHAQVDPLWFVGGLGCLTLLFFVRRRVSWIPLLWVALACLSIAINGARDLPQYFIQAAPALALASGMAAALTLPRLPGAARWIVVAFVTAATWRVGSDPFPKLAANVWYDSQHLLGRTDQRGYLARFGSREIDKYSALSNRDLGDFLASHTGPDDTVYVFGFSPGAYVYAERRSASRFFWSRPVLVGFNSGDPSYGVNGVRTDLERNQPTYIVLQEHDWAPAEVKFRATEAIQDSAPFFHAQSPLETLLRANYHRLDGFINGFEGWERNAR